jgi:hypothetical protein
MTMLNKLRYITIIIIAFTGTVNQLLAQNTVGDESVDVVSGYNPVLADAIKENFTASLPDNTTTPEPQEYDIPIDFYQIPYQPVKVKPIRLPDAKPSELENVYVKAGFGTQLTPLAEVYLNSDRNKKYNYGLFAKYISSNGKLENQNYNDLRVGGSTKFYFDDKYALPITAYYSRNTLYYYGYNEDSISLEAKDVRQVFNNYGASVGFHNIGDNPLNMDFGLKAGFDGIADINKYKEMHPYLTGWGEKKLENNSIAGAEVSYEYFSYAGATEFVNSLVGVKPYYKMITDQWSLNAGINTIADRASNAYFLPDAQFSYDLVGDKFVFVAGVDGHLQVNSFANIVKENPFVKDTLVFKNTPITEIHAGLRGSTNGNFSFAVKGYQKITQDMPFYVTDSVDNKRFDIVYSDANLWGGYLELSYFDADRFRVTGSVNVFSFAEIDKLDKPYLRPTLEWTINGMYRFNQKLSMQADVFGVNKSFALLPTGSEAEIKGAVDMNVSAVYTYSKYFNIFVNVNNLASFKYQRYYNYPSYGIQALGGLSFTF